jgi:hypothetical protein
VIDRQICLPPPPPNTGVIIHEQRTLFHNQDPKAEVLPLFAPGLSAYNAEYFATFGPVQNDTNTDKASKVEIEPRDEGGQICAIGGEFSRREKHCIDTGAHGGRVEVSDQVLGLRDAYGASVLHVAALNGKSGVLAQVFLKFSSRVCGHIPEQLCRKVQ